MSVIPHPYQEAKAEADREREISERPEAVAMQEAIFAAVEVYARYLDREGLFYADDSPDDLICPRVMATALVVTAHPIHGYDMTLIDGPCHRFYGMGVDPDPEERAPAAPSKPHARQAPRPDPFPA